jgi:5-deoxy-glucuronate isomerase
MTRLHRAAGSLADPEHQVLLTPEAAGWRHTGLRVFGLAPGEHRVLELDGFEAAVLPLAGSLEVEVDGRTLALAGRPSVFTGITDWAYLPAGTSARLTSDEGCEVAVPTAVASRRHDVAHVPAADVPVEVRGAGPATRQVTNFMAPGVFDGAENLMCVELLTPDGNWSSYPPHKHDASPECEVNNEEIYYFRIADAATRRGTQQGFGMHRTYTGPGDPGEAIEENVAVRDGDVFLIPRGYHGPCIAAPGYTMYYLNALAGPDPGRSMAFCDDPAHTWVRDTWSDMAPDPRCPMVTVDGPRDPGAPGPGP